MEMPGSSLQIEKYFEPGYSIYRATSSKDPSGGFVNTWTKVKDIVGRLRTNTRVTGSYPMKNDKKTEEHTFRFYCGIEDIQVGDEIRNNALRLEVQIVNDLMTVGRFLQVELKLIEEPLENE